MAECRHCKDTGKITLFTSIVDCDCTKPSSLDHPQDFPKDSNLKNGWYSKMAEAAGGSIVYRHPTTGQEITVTEISPSSTPGSQHPDLEWVGVVDNTKYVRGGCCLKNKKGKKILRT